MLLTKNSSLILKLLLPKPPEKELKLKNSMNNYVLNMIKLLKLSVNANPSLLDLCLEEVSLKSKRPDLALRN